MIALVQLPATAAELSDWLRGELELGFGFEYSEYERDSLEEGVWFVPVTLSYLFDDFVPTPTRRDQIEISLLASYLRVDSEFSGIETINHGQGDLLLELTYLAFPARWPALAISGRVKFPTASKDDLLGTGATDYGVQVEFFKRFGRFTPFLVGGYGVTGRVSDFDLRDGPFASVGVTASIGKRVGLGIAYEWRQSVSIAGENSHELLPFASIALPGAGPLRVVRLEPYASVGFTEASPKFAAGLQIRLGFPIR